MNRQDAAYPVLNLFWICFSLTLSDEFFNTGKGELNTFAKRSIEAEIQNIRTSKKNLAQENLT